MPDHADETDLNPLDPREAIRVNASPLQSPGRDELVRTAVVGGPELPGDRRVYLSARLLEELLDVARSSSNMRAQIDGAGVRVDLYRDGSGHHYEVWTLVGRRARPEPLPEVVLAMGAGL